MYEEYPALLVTAEGAAVVLELGPTSRYGWLRPRRRRLRRGFRGAHPQRVKRVQRWVPQSQHAPLPARRLRPHLGRTCAIADRGAKHGQRATLAVHHALDERPAPGSAERPLLPFVAGRVPGMVCFRTEIVFGT